MLKKLPRENGGKKGPPINHRPPGLTLAGVQPKVARLCFVIGSFLASSFSVGPSLQFTDPIFFYKKFFQRLLTKIFYKLFFKYNNGISDSYRNFKD
jgi:hypothetical protein